MILQTKSIGILFMTLKCEHGNNTATAIGKKKLGARTSSLRGFNVTMVNCVDARILVLKSLRSTFSLDLIVCSNGSSHLRVKLSV